MKQFSKGIIADQTRSNYNPSVQSDWLIAEVLLGLSVILSTAVLSTFFVSFRQLLTLTVMFVEIKMKNAFWLILLFLFFGCASIDPALLDEKEMSHVVSLAREKVLSEIPDLSEEGKYFIRSEQPKYTYHKLSGNYADYSIYWDIKDNQRIAVSGRGDILTLEGAKVERLGSSQVRGMLQWSKERQTITECKSGRIYWVRVLSSNPHFWLGKKVEDITSKGEEKIIAEFGGEIKIGKPSVGPDYLIDGTLIVNKILSVKVGDCNN